jgi:pimeloyl-ACP methyl ester carboxylesterase
MLIRKRAILLLLLLATSILFGFHLSGGSSETAESRAPKIELGYDTSSLPRPTCTLNYAIEPVFDFAGFETWVPDQLIASWDPAQISAQSKPSFTMFSVANPQRLGAARIEGRAFGWAKNAAKFFYADQNGELRSLSPIKQGSQSGKAILSLRAEEDEFYKSLSKHKTPLQSSNGFAVFADSTNGTISALNLSDKELLTVTVDDTVASFGVKCENFQSDRCVLFAVTVSQLTNDLAKMSFKLVYSAHTGAERVIGLGSENPTIVSISGDVVHFVARGQGYRSLWVTSPSRELTNLTPNLNFDFVSGQFFGPDRLALTDFFGQSRLLSMSADGSKILQVLPLSNEPDRQSSFVSDFGDLGYLKRSRAPGHQDQIVLVSRQSTMRQLLTCEPGPTYRGIPVTTKDNDVQSHGFWFPPSKTNAEGKVGFGNEPETLIYFHGGPSATEDGWSNLYIQKLNEMGIGVVAVNYPATPGYGDGYVLQGNLGPRAQANGGIQLLQEIARTHKVEFGRIYLLGVSFGGIPVSSLLATNELKLDGAILLSAICNINSEYVGTNAPYPPRFRPEFGPIDQNRLTIVQKKPYLTSIDYNGCNMQSVTAPVYAVVGGSDKSNIINDTRHVAETAKKARLVVVPDQGHTLAPAETLNALETAIAWFRGAKEK